MKRVLAIILCLAIFLCGCGNTASSSTTATTSASDVSNSSTAQITTSSSKPCEIQEANLLFAGALSEAEIGAENESFLVTCAYNNQIAIYSTKPTDDLPEDGMIQTFTDCITILDRTTRKQDSFNFSLWNIEDNSVFLCMDFL